MSGKDKPIFYVVSDATGQTCERVMRAVLAQFEDIDADVHVCSYVRSPEAVEKLVRDAADSGAMMVYTLVGPEERSRIGALSRELGVTAIDLLGPLLLETSDHLGKEPRKIPGLFQQLVDME